MFLFVPFSFFLSLASPLSVVVVAAPFWSFGATSLALAFSAVASFLLDFLLPVVGTSLMSFSSIPISCICFARFSAWDMNARGSDNASTKSENSKHRDISLRVYESLDTRLRYLISSAYVLEIPQSCTKPSILQMVCELEVQILMLLMQEMEYSSLFGQYHTYWWFVNLIFTCY